MSASVGAVTHACRTPTEITIELSTDAKCPSSAESGDHLVGAGIVAGPKSALNKLSVSGETATCTAGAGTNAIGTLVIYPQNENDSSVDVLVAAGVKNVRGEQLSVDECLSKAQSGTMAKGDPCIIARRRLGFVAHTQLRLPIELETQCTGVVCDAESTCSNGTCTKIETSCDAKTGLCGGPGEGGAASTGSTDGSGAQGVTSVNVSNASTAVSNVSVSTAVSNVSASVSTVTTDVSSSISSVAGSTAMSSSSEGSCPSACANQFCPSGQKPDCNVMPCGCVCDPLACSVSCTGGVCDAIDSCNCVGSANSSSGLSTSALSSPAASTGPAPMISNGLSAAAGMAPCSMTEGGGAACAW